jgi:purine-binding chemotaxis protein CheW
MTYPVNNNDAGAHDRELQLLVFRLGDEEYGLDVLDVQEIDRMCAVNKIPNTPSFVDGMINLRGSVITVINLREHFGLAKKEKNKKTRIIVINARTKKLGFIVDSVVDVVSLPYVALTRPSGGAAHTMGSYVAGVGDIGGRPVIVLDVEKLLEGIAGAVSCKYHNI